MLSQRIGIERESKPSAGWKNGIRSAPEANLFLFAFLLNFVYEVWQAPYYIFYNSPSLADKIRDLTHCTKSGEIQAQQSTIRQMQAELQGNVTAQTSTVQRLSAELKNAKTEYDRYRKLYREGAIAARTPGFAGADLANLVNEAALLAARQDQAAVTPADFNEAIGRVIAGLQEVLEGEPLRQYLQQVQRPAELENWLRSSSQVLPCST